MKLILNEYNILQDNNVTTNFIRLIDTLRVRGLIDAIGIQGHYFEFKGSGYTYPLATLKSNLDRIASIGLPIYISEFDINEPNDNTQLQNYQTYFPLFWENPGVKGITLWGYVQYDIWKTDAYLLRADGSERPSVPWLRIYVATPTAISPLGSTNEPRNTFLVWRRSTPATSYRVQVATDSLFTSVLVDSTVTDTLAQSKLLAANTKYYWHVSAVNRYGASAYSAAASFTTGQTVGIINDLAGIPSEFKLMQNYPNPFNPSTTIEYALPVTSHVTLTISDVLGRVVATLVDQVQPASRHMIQWNASAMSSGVYLYRVDARSEDGSKTIALVKKLLLVK